MAVPLAIIISIPLQGKRYAVNANPYWSNVMSPQSFSQSATSDKPTDSFSELPPPSMRQSLHLNERAEKMEFSANQEEDKTSDAPFLSYGQPLDLNERPKRRKLSPIIEEDNTLDESSLSTT